ncbi:MAG: nuclear transport factor 2 family protein [Betaproteobacteria bacterium]|nr:nuclear transport factor 2 family protein [Betaproteobacteria bacterium]
MGAPPPDLDALVAWFETLTPNSVARTAEFYAADAQFKDPFNEVRGAEAIRRIYAHMFTQVVEPRFRVLERVQDAGGALLVWEFGFHGRPGAAPSVVRGASHLKFAADGRIAVHRDYWDTGEELYAHVPLLGALLRLLRRRLAAPQA